MSYPTSNIKFFNIGIYEKIVTYCSIAVTLFSSCKREHSATDPSGKKYKASFNVANFVQKTNGFLPYRIRT